MRNYKYEVDLDTGKERMDSNGLDLQEILGLTLRPIALVHAKLYGTRPDLANSFRLRICRLILDPDSPVWQDRETSGPNDVFAIVDMPKIGGDK